MKCEIIGEIRVESGNRDQADNDAAYNISKESDKYDLFVIDEEQESPVHMKSISGILFV